MRNLKTVITGFIAAFCLACIEADGADWRLYAEVAEEDMVIYYDPASITHLPGNKIRVWIKEIYLDDHGKNEIVSSRIKSGLSARGFENHEFTLERWELDCAKKKHRLLSVVYYDNNNTVLDTDGSVYSEWFTIGPHSANDRLYEIACLHRRD